MPSASAVIVAGGAGSRFRSETPKQFLTLAGKPLLAHTLARFDGQRFHHQGLGDSEPVGMQRRRIEDLPPGHSLRVARDPHDYARTPMGGYEPGWND